MERRQAVLLVGSPKPGRSSSLALGEYLLDDLERRGWGTETVNLRRVMNDPSALLVAAARADVVILAYPLYVFGLPAPAVLALERLADASRKHAGQAHEIAAAEIAADGIAADGIAADGIAASGPRLVTIVNCGFPEHAHNDLSTEMCRLFAAQAGWHWSGALSLGGGGVIEGRPLRERGPLARSARRALEQTAAALHDGRDVPAEAVRLMAKPMIPARLYRWMSNYGWRRMAAGNGAGDRLDDRPFVTP
jgi:hypothetical protein